jgi:hypothetical protein
MNDFDHQAGLVKLDEASQFREKCEIRERKVKRLRNLIALFFAFSVVILIVSNLFMEPPLLSRISLQGVFKVLPAIENVSLAIGIVSLVLLVFSVMKSISVEAQATKARNTEGYIAQNLYRVVLMHSKRN